MERLVVGDDDQRVDVRSGEMAFFTRGGQHATGNDHAMTDAMVRIHDLDPLDAWSVGRKK